MTLQPHAASPQLLLLPLKAQALLQCLAKQPWLHAWLPQQLCRMQLQQLGSRAQCADYAAAALPALEDRMMPTAQQKTAAAHA